jgi:serine/threonine protein phosphatase PrpC
MPSKLSSLERKVHGIDYAFAGSTHSGESESGDLHLVCEADAGVLVAVIDGLGHGSEAALAARTAVAALRRYIGEPLVSLVKRCHEEMKATRGAVLGMAWFGLKDNTISLIGVGNVAGVLLRADPNVKPHSENLVMRAGLVGYQLPPLYASVTQVSVNDILILTTDGIRSGFEEHISFRESPQQIASRVCSEYGKNTDDALILVARYLGERSGWASH